MNKTTNFLLLCLVVLVVSAHVDAGKKGKRAKTKCKYGKPETSACNSTTNKYTLTRRLLPDVSGDSCDEVKTKERTCKCKYTWPNMTEIAETQCTEEVKKIEVVLLLSENNMVDNCAAEKTVTRSCKKIRKGNLKGNGKKNGKKNKRQQKRKNKKEVADNSICNLEAVTGDCRGYFQKWFYNKDTGVCEQFVYGGCRGNDNRFESMEECNDACLPAAHDDEEREERKKQKAAVKAAEDESADTNDICNLPAEPGRCMAYFEKWYYNTETQSCEKFIYGGCAGNDNRFDTEEKCKETCPPGEGGRRKKNKKGGRKQNKRKGKKNAFI